MDVSLLPSRDPASLIVEHHGRIVTQIELAQSIACKNIQRAQKKMKEYYDHHARDLNFMERTRVYHPHYQITDRPLLSTDRTPGNS